MNNFFTFVARKYFEDYLDTIYIKNYYKHTPPITETLMRDVSFTDEYYKRLVSNSRITERIIDKYNN